MEELKLKKKVIIFVLTFADKVSNNKKIDWVKDYPYVVVDNLKKSGIDKLKKTLTDSYEKLDYEITPVEGLVNEKDFVLLVTPIDKAAPKGRLILPQVETIRDLLDKNCGTLIVKESELKFFYNSLNIKPKLVITDSQVFDKVASEIPKDQLLTSFSILFARKKGELAYFVEGIKKLKSITPNAKILILESCSHHRQEDDIGTVKIPKLFKKIVEPTVTFDFAKNIPEESLLKEYELVINCAGCMVTRNRMLDRIRIL